MIKDIKKKLRSERGASIILALLLFLVCAVVGSIVLTAATAAAGRMSQMVKMDQRYYSVTSAAELLRDQIDGVKVTLEGEEITTGGDNSTTTFQVSSVKIKKTDKTGEKDIPKDATMFDFYKNQTSKVLIDTYLFDKLVLPGTVVSETEEIKKDTELARDYTLLLKKGDAEQTEVQAKISVANLTESQRGLRFVISNDNGDTNLYSLNMDCTADILKEVRSGDSGKDIITYTVTWTVSEFNR